ncbi:MAG: PQQ-binding-like beta-propeller repeat protein [Ignavibacteriaceae bacterium]
MRNLIIIFSFLLLFAAGCSLSKIQYEANEDLHYYSMFGEIPSRNFFTPQTLSDSIVKKWEADINGSFSNSSVSIYDNLVFVNDLSGRVYCFNINTGKQIGKLKSGDGVFTTPIINKFNVIYASAQRGKNESILQFYDFVKGKLINEITVEGRVISEIIKTEDAIIFNTEDGRVYKFNFFGSKEWGIETKVLTHSSPALKNNIKVFGNDNGEIVGVDALSGKIKFKEKISKPFFASPSIINETIFIGNDDGKLYAIDLNTGKVKWNFNTGGRINMSAASDSNNIYIGNLKGELFSLNIKYHSLNWKQTFDGAFSAAPLVSNNLIIQPDLESKIHFINKDDGRILKSIQLDGRAKLSPVYFKDILFIGYDNGVLAAYEFEK